MRGATASSSSSRSAPETRSRPTASSTSSSRRRSRRPTSRRSFRTASTRSPGVPRHHQSRRNTVNRLITLATTAFLALFLVGILAACTATDPRLEDEITTQVQGGTPTRTGERVVITSGADVTLPADESVDLFVIYNGD